MELDMRYCLLFFFISTIAFGEENEVKAKEEKPLVVPIKDKGSAQSVMMIDAKSRAQDFLKAYDLLKKEKASARVFYKLTNGNVVTNIVDISLFEGNTLFLFKVSSLQGVKYLVVPIEELQEIGSL